MLRNHILLPISCALFIIAVSGCGKSATNKEPKPTAGKAAVKGADKPKAPEALVGVVEGVVRLERGAKLPSYPPQMMMRQVLNITEPEPMPEGCSPAKDSDRQPVRLTEEGALAGVIVAASDYSRPEKRPPVTHDVTIEDCRLMPMLVVAAQNDQLRLRSTIDYPFMPELNGAAITQTLIKGQEKVLQLDRGGIRTVLCGFTAPCGRTDVVILYHSLYTITDQKGAFRIEKFPANEIVTLNAWHPLFRDANLKLSVQPNEIRRVEMVLSPLPEYTQQPKADKSPPKGKPRDRAGGKRRTKPSRPDFGVLY
jgi:hypothetical protein